MELQINEALNKWASIERQPQGKLFFSYAPQSGWEVKELGIIERILRYCFGMYASTHLKTIQRAYRNLHFNDLVSTEKKTALLIDAFLRSLYTVDIEVTAAEVLKYHSQLSNSQEFYKRFNRLKELADLPKNRTISKSVHGPAKEAALCYSKWCAKIGDSLSADQYWLLSRDYTL